MAIFTVKLKQVVYYDCEIDALTQADAERLVNEACERGDGEDLDLVERDNGGFELDVESLSQGEQSLIESVLTREIHSLLSTATTMRAADRDPMDEFGDV